MNKTKIVIEAQSNTTDTEVFEFGIRETIAELCPEIEYEFSLHKIGNLYDLGSGLRNSVL